MMMIMITMMNDGDDNDYDDDEYMKWMMNERFE
jgi:hypothetical protein